MCPTVTDQTNMSLEESIKGQAQIVHMNIWNGDISKFVNLVFVLSYCNSALFIKDSTSLM